MFTLLKKLEKKSKTFKDPDTQVLGLSRTTFSRTFKVLNLEKKIPGLSRTSEDAREPCRSIDRSINK